MREQPKSDSIKAISAAILKAREEIEPVKKSRAMQSGPRYNYADMMDYLLAVSGPMASAGLTMTSSVAEKKIIELPERVNKEGKPIYEYRSEICVALTVMHPESGEWWVFYGDGEGVDTKDKATGKATTYAKKYAIGCAFCLPSAEDTDQRPSPASFVKEKGIESEYEAQIAGALDENDLNALLENMKQDEALSGQPAAMKKRLLDGMKTKAKDYGAVYKGGEFVQKP